MPVSSKRVAEEGAHATQLLAGMTVVRVVRNERGVMMEFEGGVRLFVDRNAEDVEVSITGTEE